MNLALKLVTLLIMIHVIMASIEDGNNDAIASLHPRPEDPCRIPTDLDWTICTYDNGTYDRYQGCLSDCDDKTGRPCLLIGKGDCNVLSMRRECQNKCGGRAWKPICTSRNLTYSNMCEFKRDKRCHYPDLKILHKGQCK